MADYLHDASHRHRARCRGRAECAGGIFHGYDAKVKPHQKLLAVVLTRRFPYSWQPADILSLVGMYALEKLALHRASVADRLHPGWESAPSRCRRHDAGFSGHRPMQAIARVNRVFRDKPAGLVVDYIGIAQNLKKALGQYSASDASRATPSIADLPVPA